MEKERFLQRSAAQVYLVRDNDSKTEMLLAQRCGDKLDLANGSWDVAGGHCNEGESFIQAAQRNAKKELCVSFDTKDIKFTTIVHVGKQNIVGLQYICAHFFIDKWNGTPKIGESEKMANLTWQDINNLPANLNFDRAEAIKNYLTKTGYSEIGF